MAPSHATRCCGASESIHRYLILILLGIFYFFLSSARKLPPKLRDTMSNKLHVMACCTVRLATRGREPTHNARQPSSLMIFVSDTGTREPPLRACIIRPSCTRVRMTSGGWVTNVAQRQRAPQRQTYQMLPSHVAVTAPLHS